MRVLVINRNYAKLRWLDAKPQTVQMYKCTNGNLGRSNNANVYLVINRTYAKLRWLGAKPKTVQMYGKAKQRRQRLFCVSPNFLS